MAHIEQQSSVDLEEAGDVVAELPKISSPTRAGAIGLQTAGKQSLVRQMSVESDYDEIEFHIDDDTVDTQKFVCTEGGEDKSCVYRGDCREVKVVITVREPQGCEGELTRAISSTRLYDIDVTHGKYEWSIVRKFHQFEELHKSLQAYQTKQRWVKNTKILTDALAKGKGNARKMETSQDKTKLVKAEGKQNGKSKKYSKPKAIQRRISRRMSRDKSFRVTQLYFPKKPERFVIDNEKIEKRRQRLETYVNTALKDSKCRHHDSMLKFLEISVLSFAKYTGGKFHEGSVQKKAGGRKIGLHNFYKVFQRNWSERWLVLKDSYLCYLRPDGTIADVLLFDNYWSEIKYGFAGTGTRHGILLENSTRKLKIKTKGYHRTRNWVEKINEVSAKCPYSVPRRYSSYSPPRKELAKWYVDGKNYFRDVHEAICGAKDEIFITDWWLSPDFFLMRPVTDPMTSRLDMVLLEKAKQGVKIYILLYKDIAFVVKYIQSQQAKNKLEGLHKNILVMRHPEHTQSTLNLSLPLWTHHEKIVCIDQRIAFLGGLDLCFGRWDNDQHRLSDLGSVALKSPDSHEAPDSRSRTVSITVDQDWTGFGRDDLIKQEQQEIKRRFRHESGRLFRSLRQSGLSRSLNSLQNKNKLKSSKSVPVDALAQQIGLQKAGSSSSTKKRHKSETAAVCPHYSSLPELNSPDTIHGGSAIAEILMENFTGHKKPILHEDSGFTDENSAGEVTPNEARTSRPRSLSEIISAVVDVHEPPPDLIINNKTNSDLSPDCGTDIRTPDSYQENTTPFKSYEKTTQKDGHLIGKLTPNKEKSSSYLDNVNSLNVPTPFEAYHVEEQFYISESQEMVNGDKDIEMVAPAKNGSPQSQIHERGNTTPNGVSSSLDLQVNTKMAARGGGSQGQSSPSNASTATTVSMNDSYEMNTKALDKNAPEQRTKQTQYTKPSAIEIQKAKEQFENKRTNEIQTVNKAPPYVPLKRAERDSDSDDSMSFLICHSEPIPNLHKHREAEDVRGLDSTDNKRKSLMEKRHKSMEENSGRKTGFSSRLKSALSNTGCTIIYRRLV